MKSNMNLKILKLAVVEILAQSGFDRTTDQALNVLADVMRLYIEQLGQRMKQRHEKGVVAELMYGIIVDELYDESEYQIAEMLSFLRYQITIKNYLSDRYNVGSEESILHVLRILPKNAQLRMLMRSGGSLSEINKVERDAHEEGLSIDEFTRGFIESSLKENSKGEDEEYKFQLVSFIGEEEGIKKVRISDGEFNEILEGRKERHGFFKQPVSFASDFCAWKDRHVFKEYE
ncbi:histone-fold protein [Ordospora pajunii]|uniref:histone-fold protein n=1 Tax=Ordospora pajunii TaxID=3039483 RepID=UPI0029526932|nr:histone-fold protein [Ordospora pajunii]KAH9412305.1 histone-fold protein [Ordospora pajunii]